MMIFKISQIKLVGLVEVYYRLLQGGNNISRISNMHEGSTRSHIDEFYHHVQLPVMLLKLILVAATVLLPSPGTSRHARAYFRSRDLLLIAARVGSTSQNTCTNSRLPPPPFRSSAFCSPLFVCLLSFDHATPSFFCARGSLANVSGGRGRGCNSDALLS